MRDSVRAAGERIRDGWMEWQHVAPRTFLDTAIGEEELREYSLILVGGPDENAVTRKLRESIPLRIRRGAVELDGRKFEGKDLGVLMAYPHPWNTERYLAVHAGMSPRGIGFTTRMPDDYDYVISEPGEFGRNGPGFEEICTEAGWFDAAWRYDEAYGLRRWRGEAEKAVDRRRSFDTQNRWTVDGSSVRFGRTARVLVFRSRKCGGAG